MFLHLLYNYQYRQRFQIKPWKQSVHQFYFLTFKIIAGSPAVSTRVCLDSASTGWRCTAWIFGNENTRSQVSRNSVWHISVSRIPHLRGSLWPVLTVFSIYIVNDFKNLRYIKYSNLAPPTNSAWFILKCSIFSVFTRYTWSYYSSLSH